MKKFLVGMFVVDSRTGMPEFSKILAFQAVLVFFCYEGYNLFWLKQPFDMSAFAHGVTVIFAGLAGQLGVQEFFRQRFDRLHGIRRDGAGIQMPEHHDGDGNNQNQGEQ